MNVLVLNCGSSSVKFRLMATDLDLIAQNADRRLAKGTIERIGGEAIIRLQVEGHEPQLIVEGSSLKGMVEGPTLSGGLPESAAGPTHGCRGIL